MIQQQLLQDIIEIKPVTMQPIIQKITVLLNQQKQQQQQQQFMDNIVKSLFYGLWNFDKMINQHYLSTKIAEMMGKISEDVAFRFLRDMFKFISQKYNLIDKHRINKFMQLIRYLLKKGLEINQSKTDCVLEEVIFGDVQTRSGIVYHVLEIYFQTLLEVKKQEQPPKNITKKQKQQSPHTFKHLELNHFKLFEKLLQKEDTLEHLRLHIIEHIYEKHKSHIVDVYIQQPETLQSKIQQICQYFMELARKQNIDSNRKNLYTLVGFMKSEQMLFSIYLKDKIEKANQEKQKHKKKLSKHKKKIIKQAKTKRKQINKKNKRSKTTSKSKFEMMAATAKQ